MTIQVDAADFATAVEVASWVGSLIAMLVMGLIVYLMVRPSRRARRRQRTTETDALQVEEMLRLVERMEQRLEVLERAIGDERREQRILETGAQDAEDRRMK